MRGAVVVLVAACGSADRATVVTGDARRVDAAAVRTDAGATDAAPPPDATPPPDAPPPPRKRVVHHELGDFPQRRKRPREFGDFPECPNAVLSSGCP